MPKCLIALGSNLEERQATLARALTFLDQSPGMHLIDASSLHETRPVGGPSDQPCFLNGAALFETTLDPLTVLHLLHAIEDQLGRVRNEVWGPRTIDLDLLLYEQEVCEQPTLMLPHPRMAWRRFVLEPAAEVAPEMVHPTTGWTIVQLRDHLEKTPPYVALAGGIGSGKTRLLLSLAQRREIHTIFETIDTSLLSCFYARPASHAKRVELEFLRRRTEQLWPSRVENGSAHWAVSDFWFDQSVAFARVWLEDADRDFFLEKWKKKRKKVAQPRLVVFLDPPIGQLIDQVAHRGRSFERNLEPVRLEQIHCSIADEVNKPDVGPVLRLSGTNPEKDVNELIVAIDAME